MTNQLSKNEIATIAAGLKFPTECFIDGAYIQAHSGKTFETINPANGGIITSIAAGDKADIDIAVSNARATFNKGT